MMSFASGCMDIISYRELGQVFTSAMTGNAALLGLDLGQGNISATARNLAAFVGFLIGLTLGAALLRCNGRTPGRRLAATSILLIEEALLVLFVALWHFGAGPSSDGMLYGLILLSAIAMGAQSVAAHNIGVAGVTTTYFTGTLTSIVVGLVGRGHPRRRSAEAKRPARSVKWPVLAFVAYVAGAGISGLLLLKPVQMVVALPAVVIAVVLLVTLVETVLGRFSAGRSGQGHA